MQHELVNDGCLHNLCCCRQPGTSCPISSSISCLYYWRQASAAVKPILELQLLGTGSLPLFSHCKNINLRWKHRHRVQQRHEIFQLNGEFLDLQHALQQLKDMDSYAHMQAPVDRPVSLAHCRS